MNLATRTMAALAVAASTTAHAGLLGDTVTAEWDFQPIYDQVTTFVVGPGVELFRSWGGGETLNIGDNTITVFMARREVGLGSGVTWRFTDLDFGSGIGGVQLSTDFWPLDRNHLTFTGDSIELSFDPGVSFPRGQGFLRLTLLPVPEPHRRRSCSPAWRHWRSEGPGARPDMNPSPRSAIARSPAWPLPCGAAAPSGAITGPTRIVSSGCSSMKTIRSATRSAGIASPGIGAGRFCSHIGVATAAGSSACTLMP